MSATSLPTAVTFLATGSMSLPGWKASPIVGGICISRQVLDQVEGKLDLNFRELGRQNLKNIAKPVEVYAIQLDGAVSPGSRFLAAADLKQEICYSKAPDGVRLAYATGGSGPPLLKSAHWLGHLEYDWEMPIFQHFLLRLSHPGQIRCARQRPVGLDVHEISLDAWVSDMETVADAAGLDRFPLLGFSQGCSVSIVCRSASGTGVAFNFVRRLCGWGQQAA